MKKPPIPTYIGEPKSSNGGSSKSTIVIVILIAVIVIVTLIAIGEWQIIKALSEAGEEYEDQ